MRLPTLWLRFAGIGATGIAVIACATSASAVGVPQARPLLKGTHSSRAQSARPPAQPRTSVPAQPSAQPQQPAQLRVTTQPRLSAAQRAGQRVIYSYAGLNPPGRLLWLIRHGQAAGVIFFGANISSEAQIAGVIRQFEAADAARTNPVHAPLLLMTDQEGGLVTRLPGRPFLSEKQIGAARNPGAAATTAGQGAAANLLGVGMNVNLAPVLDVYRQAGDFDDQFQRSYSKNPRVVSRLGADFIRAQQKGRVAATAKHFPGLGAAGKNQDTDAVPVTLNVSLASLHNTDEFPYQAAIGAGVKLVMASWAVYPALDRSRPAGLSSHIIQGQLRTRLGFKGVTITDAIEAGALRSFGSISNRAELAAGAGMDLILCAAQNVAEGVNCRNGLQSGYASGKLNHAAYQAALTRVLKLRAGLPK
ncbi:MAG: glycoside hydrolase family 3 N-terminal domain-containing protein [Streptosporangiaceae bacterium]